MQANPPAIRSVSKVARIRADGLEKWLRENAPTCSEEQKHLDQGSAERAYWHHGYLSALRDILKLTSEQN